MEIIPLEMLNKSYEETIQQTDESARTQIPGPNELAEIAKAVVTQEGAVLGEPAKKKARVISQLEDSMAELSRIEEELASDFSGGIYTDDLSTVGSEGSIHVRPEGPYADASPEGQLLSL